MGKLSYRDFLDFLSSDLDEIEYFGCNKNSLISLREYLNELKQKNEEYERLIQEPLESIKKKNKWVKNIVPRYDGSLNRVQIFGKNQPNLGVGINPKIAKAHGKNPDDYILTGGMIITPFHDLKVRNRIKVLDNSQKEIREIDKIAQKLHYFKEQFNTISGNFSTKSSCYNICYIECFDWPIIKVIISTGELQNFRPMMSDSLFYKKEGMYPKPLSSDDKERLVKKLYIKR